MANPASGFDLLSPVYDLLQRLFFGNSLVRAQNYFLAPPQKTGTVLVVGGGTGKILVEMLRQNIGQSYVYVDISKSMIRATKRRVRRYFKTEKADGARPRIQYVCADIGRMPLAKYDLVITPFVLDCFGDAALSLLIPKLAQALSRRGSWIFTDFHIAEGRPQPLARLLIRFLYFCFNRFCGLQRSQLPDFPFFFRSAQLEMNAEYFFLRGLVVTRVYRPAEVP